MKDSHAKNETIYHAPVSGVYHVSEKIWKHVPNGKKKEVPNFDRRWFQFWKPKTIIVDDYDTILEYSGTRMVHLKQGQPVPSTYAPVRLK